MYVPILKTLLENGHIDEADAVRITQRETQRPFSLHWELKSMLYLGVVLLNLGLGYLIYENIESIGHIALTTAIGVICLGCFWYAFRYRADFSPGETKSPTPYYDYVLMLGCLTFLILEGYVQYQYNIFGNRYGLATVIPMILFLGLAYYLDNRGVLSLGITALAAWLGITVTPYRLLSQNDFHSETIILTGIGLAVFLNVVLLMSERIGFKKHFSLTYLNFSVHLYFVACLSGMFTLDQELLYFLLLSAGVAFYLWYARWKASFYLLTISVIYAYIGVTYLVFHFFDAWITEGYLLYFIITCGGIIAFFLHYKKFFNRPTL